MLQLLWDFIPTHPTELLPLTPLGTSKLRSRPPSSTSAAKISQIKHWTPHSGHGRHWPL